MERVHPLAVLIGTPEENPYWHKTFIENRAEAVESAREAVYKERPGPSVPNDAGVVELADARDSKSRVRKDVRVQVPPPAPYIIKQLRLTWSLRGGYKLRLCH
jgi:hypothetical protein